MKFFSKLWDFLINNLDRILVGLLVFMVIIFIGVMSFDCVKNCVSELIGLNAKNKILTFLGIGMGGILIVLLLSWKSAMSIFSKLWQFLIDNLDRILVVSLIVLAIVFVVVMVPDKPSWSFKIFGVSGSENRKYEVLKFLGIGMGGILIALQALASHRRAKAMEETVSHTEQGLRQERLKNAIEHLGDEKDIVRLGGAYELFQLAKDAKEDTKELRQTALDMLCLHIRQMTEGN